MSSFVAAAASADVTYLKTRGDIFETLPRTKKNSLIKTRICNYSIRNKKCSFKLLTTHYKKQNFLLSGKKGDVYLLDTYYNKYNLVLNPSTLMTSICFINSTTNLFCIGYSNGDINVVDFVSKKIVHAVDKSLMSSFPRIMNSHPYQPILIVAGNDNTVSIWNINSFLKSNELCLSENVIDIAFEMKGDVIAVVLEYSGVIFYRTSDLFLIAEFPFPEGERRTTFIKYISQITMLMSTDNKNEIESSAIRIILVGDNSALYIWSLLGFAVNESKRRAGVLIGIVDLPTAITTVVDIKPMYNSSISSRLCLLSSDWDLYIVDCNESSLSIAGAWTIAAILPSALISPSTDKSVDYTNGIISINGTNMVVLASDGSAVIFDTTSFAKSYKGLLLKSRSVYNEVSVLKAQVDIIHKSIEDKKQSVFDPSPFKGDTDSTDLMATADNSKEANFSGIAIKAEIPQDRIESVTSRQQALLKAPTTSSITSSYNFELTGLNPKERLINEKKLRRFLNKSGEFPDKYRQYIWQFLLNLPNNTLNYEELIAKGLHKNYQKLALNSSNDWTRGQTILQRCCSAIAHWAPPFVHSSYLPQLIFPFTTLFQSDIVIVEIVMTLLIWWGYSWHMVYPNEPSHIIQAIDELLLLHDPKLHLHFDVLEISAGEIGWRLISTLFTEFLSKSDWLKLMDFLFINIKKPSFVLLVPIAFMRVARLSFLNADISKHVLPYFKSQQGVNLQNIIDLIEAMAEMTPSKYFVVLTSPDKVEVSKKNKTKITTKSSFISTSTAIFPLPIGKYPIYDGYPRNLLELQQKSSEEESNLQVEIASKEKLLRKMENDITVLESDHEKWMSHSSNSLEAERKQKKLLIERMTKNMEILQIVEEKLSKQKIATLGVINAISANEISAARKKHEEANELAQLNEKHFHDSLNFLTNMKKHQLLSGAIDKSSSEILKDIDNRRKGDKIHADNDNLENLLVI